MSWCLKCGEKWPEEIHDPSCIWFDHFYVDPIEERIVDKMAKQIQDEVDKDLLKSISVPYGKPMKITAKWTIPDDHPLHYMTDLGDLKREDDEAEERDILPKKFVCVAVGPKNYDDLWDPHPFGLEDEPWHQTDLREIRWLERTHAEQKKAEKIKRYPWFIRLLGGIRS